MKSGRIFILTILISILVSSIGTAQTDSTEIKREKIVAEKYMQLAYPAEEHLLLEKMVGEWDLEIKFWAQPGGKAVVTTGTCQTKMILDGRFLESKSRSGEGFYAMEALIIMGFDRRYEHYTYIGFDTWGTYYVTASGDYNEDFKQLRMYGEDFDAAVNFTQKYDVIINFIDDDKFVNEIVFKNPELTDGADEFKMVEISYTRKK